MSLLSWLGRELRSDSRHSHKPENLDQVILSAAESHLAHEAKLDALSQMVLVDDLEQLAFDDREQVRQYRQQKLGINTTPESGIHRRGGNPKRSGKLQLPDDVGHILGDVHIEQPNKGGLTSLANALIPLAAIALAGWLLWNQMQPTQEPQPADSEDNITDVSVGFGTPEDR